MIIHIGSNEKFIHSFIEFEKNNLKKKNNSYYFLKYKKVGLDKLRYKNVKYYSRNLYERARFYLDIAYHSIRCDKIILHGFFDMNIALLLILLPSFGKKTFWVLWGGDLYSLINRNCSKIDYFLRSRGLRKIGFILTYIKGDYELAKSRLNYKGELINCLMYESNICYDIDNITYQDELKPLKIMVGNSGDPGNNHLKVFKILKSLNLDVRIYCPLSYGSKKYIEHIILLGKKYFGKNFIELVNFMPREKYDQFLSKIDIAIFAHDRQQAMGNIINLLGRGKKVFLNNTTSSKMLISKKIKIYSLNDLTLKNILNKEQNSLNSKKIKLHFNKDKLIRNWKYIYEL